MSTITEKTLIPIGAVTIIAGAMFWLSTVYSLAASADKRSLTTEGKQDSVAADISAIKTDVAVIKQILKERSERKQNQ